MHSWRATKTLSEQFVAPTCHSKTVNRFRVWRNLRIERGSRKPSKIRRVCLPEGALRASMARSTVTDAKCICEEKTPPRPILKIKSDKIMSDGGPASACDILGRPILSDTNAAGRAAANYDRVHSQSLIEQDLTNVSLSCGNSRIHVFFRRGPRTASSFS